MLAEERLYWYGNQTPSAFTSSCRPTGRPRRLPQAAQSLPCGTWYSPARHWSSAGWRTGYSRHAADAPALVNMFGITETTVHVTHVALDVADATANKGSVIGAGIRTRAFTCLMTACSQFRQASSANSTSRVRVWPGDISTVRH